VTAQLNGWLTLPSKARVSDQPPTNRFFPIRIATLRSCRRAKSGIRHPKAVHNRISVLSFSNGASLPLRRRLRPGQQLVQPGRSDFDKIWTGPLNARGVVDYAASKSTDLITIIVAFTWRWTTYTFILKRSLKDNPRVNAQKPLVHHERPLHAVQDRISQGIDTQGQGELPRPT
jgi:hypothetical protein